MTSPPPVGGSVPIIVLLSGPNLGLLGDRQREIYGTTTLADHVDRARSVAEAHGFVLEHHQSESEAELVTAVHRARRRAAAIVINAGALTHYGWSLHDALATFDGPVIEVHLSNPEAREPWRRRSVIAPASSGTIAGFGALSYELALEAVARLLDPPS
jgi:3-dehydroquinate dehydratase-2